ncbi:hypothetical protein [Streptosporangium sp. NPDC048865]|uniref:hypothetical protein n=1 Tax=Streptosporangium sp. NPDC048865 TaxID=3155766 RepID=UPI00342A52FD
MRRSRTCAWTRSRRSRRYAFGRDEPRTSHSFAGQAAIVPGPAEHLPAASREALPDVVRHARAPKADVPVDAGGERPVPAVAGDGVGSPAEGGRSGPRDLRVRRL